MKKQDAIAVIGAGVIGTAVAYALAREGRSVLLLDQDDPGMGGASFGNVGHIATELISPLPSLGLLFSVYRELFLFDGALDVAASQWIPFLPWAARFARAAFQQEANTKVLAPLVRPAAAKYEQWLREAGRPDLLRRHGHYEIWLGDRAERDARLQSVAMAGAEIHTEPAPKDLLERIGRAAGAASPAGLWFPDTAHVADPLEIVRTFAAAAVGHKARFHRAKVRALQVRGSGVEVITETETIHVGAAVVCAGAWSASFLTRFGLRVPLEAVGGYHVEVADAPLAEAPILYSDTQVLVTPMAGRLRASSYMEFAGLDARPDERKSRRLTEKVKRLGYLAPPVGPAWRGARPTLPDYLPAIGRVPGAANVFYATGHQHIGLTIAPTTGELIADLVADREPRFAIAALDLQRF